MKHILLAFLLSRSLMSPAQPNPDVLHYRFTIVLNDNNDTIYGKAEIRVAVPASGSTVSFRLTSLKNDGKGMMVDSAKIEELGRPGISPGSMISHSNDVLSFPRLNPAKNANDTEIVTIYYHGVPDDGLVISKNKYGQRTFFADNWPDRAHHWIPCQDDPADKASVEFVVAAPAHYKVISNGLLIEETDLPHDRKLTHWKEDEPLPTKVMVIGVADFAVDTVGVVNGIPVSSWVFSKNRENGFHDYAPAKEILSFFMNYIGSYPYKKLANVQSKTIFGGMENASAIFYFENSVTGEGKVESLLAHEIVHQWFGDMATEKSFPHLWLSEGFATYLTHVYTESRYGTDSLEKEMKRDRREIIDFVKESDRPVVDSVSPYMKLLNENSYQKGGWVLHMLRRQLGDSIFHAIIRKYYDAYAGKNADTRDFQKICEQVSGKDLGSFFQQWLYTPGIPRLNIQWKYNQKSRKVTVTVKQLQENLFWFPLELQLRKASGKTQRLALQVNRKDQQFIFATGERITGVDADPRVSVLFDGHISGTK